MKSQSLDLKTLKQQLLNTGSRLNHYSVIGFVVLVAVLYGFVMFRITTLSTAEPSQEVVSGQVKAARIPHIDQEVVKQLQSLQDNSVSVQSLFDQARSNPFQ